jgi:ATP-dependent helicase HrpA
MPSSIDIARLRYRTELPIYAQREKIVASIVKHQVVVVTGETGCGKTTQLPLLCLEALGGKARIAVTQPRRIAAVSIARRVADDMKSAVGEIAGFRTRFDECVSATTQVLFQTDGILVSEIGRDRFFNRYDAIIIDEAHERNLNIDLLVGHLRWLIRRRRDLKIIISSATINPELFSQAFDNAPIIEVKGRTFPIEIVYDPFDETKTDVAAAAVKAVEKIDDTGEAGDLLLFMPTERDIVAVKRMLDGRKLKTPSVTLPLFARLSRPHQEQIFRQMPKRKIVVATNIAETSITVPGIRFVIDGGLARIKRFQPHSRITALPVERISRASADQRAGRCGRTQEGVCVRLYDEETYAGMERFTPPEIARSNMAGVILTMAAQRLGAVENFAFVEPPPKRAIADGYTHLRELGALDDENRLKPVGRQMAAYPLDPHLSRMIVAGKHFGALDETLIIAAALSCMDPRERPIDKTEAADQAHRTFADPLSDFVWYLNVWRRYHDEWKKNRSQARMRAWCAAGFLSFLRVKEWRDIHAQLVAVMGRPSAPAAGNFERIHKSLLAGLIATIALRNEEAKNYKMSHGGSGVIFPGSMLAKKGPPWVMFAEKVETSRLFLRTAAAIDPAWIAEVAPHLVHRRYSDPRFDEENGTVRAVEHQVVFGLTIAKVGVAYGRINPGEANDLFIRDGLIETKLRTHHKFLAHNWALTEEIAGYEAKLRVHDLYAGDEALFSFYKERIPEVASIHDLNKTIKTKGGDDFLFAKIDALLTRPLPGEVTRWPDHLSVGGVPFNCSYKCDPSDPADGMTLHLPKGGQPFFPPGAFSWLVQPLWERRIEALLESLPKELRKRLIPVRETAARCAKSLSERPVHFCAALAACVREKFGIEIPADLLRSADIPSYLWIHTAYDDERQEAKRAVVEWEKVVAAWGKRDVSTWDFGDLPDSVTLAGGDVPLFGYPALCDRGDSVDLIACTTRVEAERLHGCGVARLVEIELEQEFAWLDVNIKLDKMDRLALLPLGDPAAIVKRAVHAVAERFGAPPDPHCRSQRAFSAHIAGARTTLASAMKSLMGSITESGRLCARIAGEIAAWKTKRSGHLYSAALKRLTRELTGYGAMVCADDADFDYLLNLPRYLNCLGVALRRAMDDPVRYGQRVEALNSYEKALAEKSVPVALRRECRALLEEYKISLFAQQEVKAKPGTSEKKLAEVFGKIKTSK